jgi:tetratricopeptide (TPR) repeat protein
MTVFSPWAAEACMRRVYWIGLFAFLVLASSCEASDDPVQISDRQASTPAIVRTPDWHDLFTEGKLAYKRGEFNAALGKLEPALDGAQREHGADSGELIEVIDQLAMTQRELANPTAAEALFRRELALNESAHGKTSVAYVENLLDLGQTLSDLGNGKRAAPYIEEANAILAALPKTSDSVRAWALHELGGVRYNQDRDREAEDLWRQALAIRLRLYGEKSTRTATTLFNLATVTSNDSAKNQEALHLFERALAGYEAEKPDHPDVGITLLRIADIKRDEDAESAEIIPLYRRALTIYEHAYGSEHKNLVEPMNELSEVLEDDEQYREAIALRLRLLALIEKHGSAYGNAMLQHTQLVQDYSALGDKMQAERHKDVIDKFCASNHCSD